MSSNLRERKPQTDTQATEPKSAPQSVFLANRAKAAPIVANTHVAAELRGVVDDALRQVLVEDFRFVEDNTVTYVYALLGYAASIFCIAGSAYSFVYSFDKTKDVIFASLVLYSVFSALFSAYAYFVKSDILFVGIWRDPTGADPPSKITVRAAFDKYSDVYPIRLQSQKGVGAGKFSKLWVESRIEASFGEWFDEDGLFLHSRFRQSVVDALGQSNPHLA
ncbi:hypothetical protein HK105_206226 [Polyrhizophydium stewartii]|uniref:Signal peptidase complex subunit 2 n=1 Tax=Polyrhizophydium stewartii TaxID=2732419 RepID=A0ABR4N431_9FUNG